MTDTWNTMTVPQATVISGGLTLVAAIVGVLLGAWLFSGRVTDLKGAVEETDRVLKTHKDFVERSLAKLQDQFHAYIVSNDEMLGLIRGQLGELHDEGVTKLTPPAQSRRDQIKNDWSFIKDDLERRAADTDFDGRTRAKYWRIDRRNYIDLVNALAGGGKLGNNAALYRDAVNLWHRFRNGRVSPSEDDLKAMSALRETLVGGPERLVANSS